jgi:excisionase family DNA binding protein
MSQKFLSLDEAAEKLGVTKERLNELREGGVLNGYRDGASWKFRTEVIDRFVEEGLPQPEAFDDDLDLDLGGMDDLPLGGVPAADSSATLTDDIGLGVEPLGDGDDAESILLAEGDLEGGLPRPPSTIIGKADLGLDDSDLKPAAASRPAPAPAAPVARTPDPSPAAFDDLEELELDLEAESSRILDASDVAAVKKAAAAAADSGSLGLGDELELDIVGSSSGSGPAISLASDSGSMGVLGSDSDPANPTDPGITGALPAAKPASQRAKGADAVELGMDDDDDLVLGDSGDLALASGSGSGMLSTSDSGINLRPSDSGIALDEMQLDLGGSAMGSALDLASLSASAQASRSAVSEDAFLLTPADAADADEEDSSQVVALDDLSDEESPVAFEEEGPDGFGGDDGLEGDFAAGIGAGAVGAPVAMAAASTTFPGWVVGVLASTVLMMALCGIVGIDLLQSMWSWDEPFAVNSWFMDQIMSLGS